MILYIFQHLARLHLRAYIYIMSSIILTANNQDTLAKLIKMAEKLNVKVSTLSEEHMEDFGLYLAMQEGTQGEYVSRESVMEELAK